MSRWADLVSAVAVRRSRTSTPAHALARDEGGRRRRPAHRKACVLLCLGLGLASQAQATFTASATAAPSTVMPGEQICVRWTALDNSSMRSSYTFFEMPLSTPPLPRGLRFKGASITSTGSNPGCFASTQEGNYVYCSAGDTGLGGVTVVRTCFDVSRNAPPGSIHFFAQMGNCCEPPVEVSANATILRPASADVAVMKSTDSQQVPLGGVVTYSLAVANDGPDRAQGVVLTDTLPPELSVESVSSNLGSCAHSGNDVSCELGDIDAGAGGVVTIMARVTTSQIGTVVNTASVSSSAPVDPHTENNGSQASVELTLPTVTIQPAALSQTVYHVGDGFQQAFTVDGDAADYTFSISGQVPPDLSLAGNVLQGTFTAPGEFTFQIDAQHDSIPGLGASQSYGLSVLLEGIAIVDTLEPARQNASYGHQLTVLGGTRPYRWSIVDGGPEVGLPPGMALSYPGLIYGVPTATGDYAFDVRVVDAAGNSAQKTLNLPVQDEGLLPLSVPSTLPEAAVGIPYDAPILATGGVPPYHCALAGGSLPPGLGLQGCNGSIGGTPAQAGDFPFAVEITDSADTPHVLTLPLSITVLAGVAIPPDEPPVVSLADEQVSSYIASVQVPESGPSESWEGLAVDAYDNAYAVGYAYSGSSYDLRLIKGLPRGTVQDFVLGWDQAYDSGGNDLGFAVAVSPKDQSVYAGGYVETADGYEALLMKLDPNGVPMWERRLAGEHGVDAFYALTADDTGVYAAGERYNGSGFDGLLAYYNDAGELVWQQGFDTGASESAYAVALNGCDDPQTCQIVVGGTLTSGAGSHEGWVATFAGLSGEPMADDVIDTFAYVQGLAVAPDNAIYVGGTTPDGNWMVKRLDRNLQFVWEQDLDLGGEAVLRAALTDREGNLYAVGRRRNGETLDVHVAAFTPAGDLAGQASFTGLVGRDQVPASDHDEVASGAALSPLGCPVVLGEQGQADGSGGAGAFGFDVLTGKDLCQ